jgi:hypothetical protein
LRSATIGVRAEIASKSSMVKSISSSFAIATRWRTPLVEPPVAAIDAAAFSRAAFVMIWDGLTSRRTRSRTSLPAASDALFLERSSAGMSFWPAGLMPRNSSAVAMVFAVNCPPQAPAAGHATLSSSCSSSAVIFPAAWAPICS